MTNHQVVIAGGGPTAMMLAGELALAGVDTVILERNEGRVRPGSRAGGLNARTLEVFDQRGIAGRFLAAGQTAQVAGFGDTRFDLTGFPTRHPYGLALWQNRIEEIILGWIEELGVPILRGREVTGIAGDADGVAVAVADGSMLRADWLVGCDGGRSAVRKAAGIAFPGSNPTISHLIAEAEMADPPPLGLHTDASGTHGISRVDYRIVDGRVVYADGGPVRIMLSEPQTGAADEPTIADLRAALTAVYGSDFGVHAVTWLSRFTDAARQAERYRAGRVLLAGDAAHIHYPAGGQGLNLGVQDAVNLGWKLALVANGRAPETLLDTYEAERHPVAARVLRMTMAVVAIRRTDDRSRALAGMIGEWLRMDEPRRQMTGMLSGLDIRYDLGVGHPLTGRRMPDLDLVTQDGPRTMASLLHPARAVLIDFGGAVPLGAGGWQDRVDRVEARPPGHFELPVVGTVAAPAAVLVRPDGYVAWAGDGSADGLAEALARWLGPPLP